MENSKTIENEAECLFQKVFTFEPCSEWVLPSQDLLNTEETWVLNGFAKRKNELNTVKSLLNDKGELWQKHTYETNKAGCIRDIVKKLAKPEMLTQAWCKFFEILSAFPVVSEETIVFHSFHLCEAPGAFVSALNYYLCLNHPRLSWEWFANTLNPYYEGRSIKETVVDDRLLFHTLDQWHFGADNTGDVMASDYLSSLESFLEMRKPIHLVTADGSISCLENPAEQELTVSRLQYSELLIALHILSPGGSFVIKKFTFFECTSICTLYLLNCLFEKVNLFKPATSKPGNSEVYVICLGYKGADIVKSHSSSLQHTFYSTDVALLPKSAIPSSFIHQLERCCDVFMNYQICAIRENIQLFNCMTKEKLYHLKAVKNKCVDVFLRRSSLKRLSHNRYRRLYYTKKKAIKTSYGQVTCNLRYLYHEVMGSTFEKMESYKSMTWEDSLIDIEARFESCFPVKAKRSLSEMSWMPVWNEVVQTAKHIVLKDGITIGKPYNIIQNSKFSNPLLFLLWNEVIKNDQEVFPQNHWVKSPFSWDWDGLKSIVKERDDISSCGVVLDIQMKGVNCSLVATGIMSCINDSAKVHVCSLDDISQKNHSGSSKIVVVDSTSWNMASFNYEVVMQRDFIKVLSTVIPSLKFGDCLVICFPSLLTRSTVGILFLLLSLFAEAATVQPLDTSPALTGQIWMLRNFQNPSWTPSLLEYLEYVSSYDDSGDSAILEVVPITYICDGYFYEYLLDTNHCCMLQRLRSLISTEKIRTKKKSE